MPAPADCGGCKAGKLGDEVDGGLGVLLGARTEGRPEVGVAVVLDPVDHQVVAVPQAGEGGWPGRNPTTHSQIWQKNLLLSKVNFLVDDPSMINLVFSSLFQEHGLQLTL